MFNQIIEQIILLIVLAGPIVFHLIKYYISHNYIIVKSPYIEPQHKVIDYSIIKSVKAHSYWRKRDVNTLNNIHLDNQRFYEPLELKQMSSRARRLYEKYGDIAGK